MRRRLIIMALAVALVGAAAFAATRGDDDGRNTSARSSFADLSEQSGEVTVQATLLQLTDNGAVAKVVFDTHSAELDLDIAAGATLTVDGVSWPTEGWEGDGPSGHHREGELRFSAASPSQGDAILTIGGLSEPVTFRWPNP